MPEEVLCWPELLKNWTRGSTINQVITKQQRRIFFTFLRYQNYQMSRATFKLGGHNEKCVKIIPTNLVRVPKNISRHAKVFKKHKLVPNHYPNSGKLAGLTIIKRVFMPCQH